MEIITEDFKQNLFSKPSGQRKTNPTIFDELRWATQHAERPLEQTLQMISEFHGAWTGMSQNLHSLVSTLGNVAASSNGQNYIATATAALNALNAVGNIASQVGRVNNITASKMSVELLREFVSRCQSLHPAINTYIQMNIGKYPYFQQISESVGSLGQIVLHQSEVGLLDRLNSDGDVNMNTSCRLRRNTSGKLFDAVKPLVENSANFMDTLFVRCMPMENNMGLLNPDYGKSGTAMAHGHSTTMDTFMAKRNKDAIKPCIAKAASKFGPALELCNPFFPVKHRIKAAPEYTSLVAEGESYIADGFNRPSYRESIIPIATEDAKMEEVN